MSKHIPIRRPAKRAPAPRHKKPQLRQPPRPMRRQPAPPFETDQA